MRDIPGLRKVVASRFNDFNTDVTFAFDTDAGVKEIHSHRMLLSENPLLARDLDCSPDRIRMETVSFEAFKVFLDHFYHRRMAVTQETVRDVAMLAKHYQVPKVLAYCEVFVTKHITADTVFHAMQTANLCSLPMVLHQCKKFIGRHASSVLRSDNFLLCDKATLKSILELERMRLDETYVFDACIEWAQKQCEIKNIASHPAEWRQQLGDCFELIRFPEMSPLDFAERLDDYQEFFTPEEARTLYTTIDPKVKFFRNSVEHSMGFGMMPRFTVHGDGDKRKK